jgi:hypothetical protein
MWTSHSHTISTLTSPPSPNLLSNLIFGTRKRSRTRHTVDLPGVVGETSEVETVLDQLNRCDVVHFACHGRSNHVDPFDSSLILYNNIPAGPISDKLTVRQIVDAHLERATIAYLSAYSTAENRASILQDEVVYLASGFQVAGFSHVIASNGVCVEMAKGFYPRLRQNHVGSLSRRGVAELACEC